MVYILIRKFITWNMYINTIIILMCYPLSNAQDVREYLDVGEGTGTFTRPLSKGFHPGGSIFVNGTAHPNAGRFYINLEDDSGSNVYLHIVADFENKKMRFANKENGDWSPGYDGMTRFTTGLSGISPAAKFELSVLCNATGYMININKSPCYFFAHLSDTSRIRNIKFAEGVTINSVLYIPGNHTCQLEGCSGNEECVFEDEQFQCQCADGYSGQFCQDTCKTKGCTGNDICVFSNEKYACRRRTDLAVQANSTSIKCRHPYVAVDSECIWVVMTMLNWDAARFRCQESGGFLMEPDFPINFKQYMSNNYPDNGSSKWAFWIGGADRGLQRWVWVTSLTDLQEDFPWGPDEPNEDSHGVKEDCMNLLTTSNKPYFYNDHKCHLDFFYICEAPPLVTSTAAVQVGEIASLYQGSHMQVAILVLLIITMISGAGILIYNNISTIKKAYSSFETDSIPFSKQFAGKLNKDNGHIDPVIN